ncbi:MAG: hypothetical protein WA082_00135 [Candidatus Moraniibacteriota bacterium]
MHALIAAHAFLGEAGALAFLWVFIELLNASASGLKRARLAALLGLLFLVGSWIVGGTYYLTDYSAAVKPIIKAGPYPWAHAVITETKEHVFLFLPFLALLTWGLLTRYRDELLQNHAARKAVMAVALLIVLMAFAMAGMGFIISSGLRAALEAKAL